MDVLIQSIVVEVKTKFVIGGVAEVWAQWLINCEMPVLVGPLKSNNNELSRMGTTVNQIDKPCTVKEG